ncbi:MAG: ArsR/SmtB family transcription factor [Myxococcales bacterium]
MKATGEPELVGILGALGDSRRFRMVQELAAAAGELSCGELGARFDLAQPTVSHHLKILVDAGLVEARQAGQHHFLSVNRDLLRRLATLLPEQLAAAPPRAKRRSKRSTQRSSPTSGRRPA